MTAQGTQLCREPRSLCLPCSNLSAAIAHHIHSVLMQLRDFEAVYAHVQDSEVRGWLKQKNSCCYAGASAYLCSAAAWLRWQERRRYDSYQGYFAAGMHLLSISGERALRHTCSHRLTRSYCIPPGAILRAGSTGDHLTMRLLNGVVHGARAVACLRALRSFEVGLALKLTVGKLGKTRVLANWPCSARAAAHEAIFPWVFERIHSTACAIQAACCMRCRALNHRDVQL